MDKTIGIIGLGIMGGAFSTNILQSGYAVVGRDIEGVGEELREAGAPVCRDFDELVEEAGRLLTDEARADAVSMRARSYAARYSWANQASRHLEIADALVKSRRSGGPVGRGRSTGCRTRTKPAATERAGTSAIDPSPGSVWPRVPDQRSPNEAIT